MTTSSQPSKNNTTVDKNITSTEDKEIGVSTTNTTTPAILSNKQNKNVINSDKLPSSLKMPSQSIKFKEPQIPDRSKVPRRKRTPYVWDDQLNPVYDEDSLRYNEEWRKNGGSEKFFDSKRMEVDGRAEDNDELRSK
ncbi:1505_t:CDS:1 [Acaulospora morrowiae]|uniref:1505_t:CDS:1 n=1 Tax=Acaulospora morrowiae TaxID=94023 RepID=A0A9N9GR21_9GLOM|nr:1505_t:CDS:1 [Acaulospora morrowiae]